MAKTENELIENGCEGDAVDDNNNSDNPRAKRLKTSNFKYQLRPRSANVRHRCDSDCEFQDTRHKPRAPPLSRYRRKTANARERYRMRQINTAFESLRGVLPSWVCSRRAASDMTKIATLRLASAYIRSLQDILDGTGCQETCSWVLSSILENSHEPQKPQQGPEGLGNPNSSAIETSSHSDPESELVSFLCGSSDSKMFQDNLETFSYLSPMSESEAMTLLLGADPPTSSWSQTQLSLVS
ncbi:helix-loop-helix protein ngn-1-like [Macrobrachium rosenbergii]|uniref:helix-loop-helix protein ngn-1-like n=1 Tax=Macrobrachium rosenbergii TaxID=79674 RepID=UPI0034D4AAFE